MLHSLNLLPGGVAAAAGARQAEPRPRPAAAVTRAGSGRPAPAPAPGHVRGVWQGEYIEGGLDTPQSTKPPLLCPGGELHVLCVPRGALLQ